MNQSYANDSVCNDSVPISPIYRGWMYHQNPLQFGVEGVATMCIGIFGVIGNIFTLLTLARQVGN